MSNNKFYNVANVKFSVFMNVIYRLLFVTASVFYGQNALAENNTPIVLVDDEGVEHTFEKPLTRIVSLMPHATELLYEVGAGDLIVGAVEYSNYPEEAKAIPRVGGYGALNMEAIIALQPDLLISWPSKNSNREISRLKDLGMPIFVSDPMSFSDISNSLITYGKITGKNQEAKRAQLAFDKKFKALRDQYSQQEKVTVFYQVWDSPLITQNGDTFINQGIEVCGGINIFADLPMANPQVSVESILVLDPQVIVASGMGESRPEWLNDWLKYPMLQAVKNNHLYHVSPDLFQRPTSRFLLGTEQLCKAIQKVRE